MQLLLLARFGCSYQRQGQVIFCLSNDQEHASASATTPMGLPRGADYAGPLEDRLFCVHLSLLTHTANGLRSQ